MKFKPSQAAEQFIEDVHQRVGARNKAVLGRSALMMALGTGIPDQFKSSDSLGADLNDETVLGDDGLREVVRTALNFRSGKTLEETGYRQEFKRAFDFGCLRMKELWEDAGRDQSKFVAELLKLGGDGIDVPPGARSSSGAFTRSVVDTAVELRLLEDEEPWVINDTEKSSNSLMVVSGQPGCGKSQLALDLLAQMSRQGVRFLFFDLKGELEDPGNDAQKAANRKKFFDLTGAQYVRLIDSPLPVNPLYSGKTGPETANIASRIASVVRAFGPQMGPNQESAIRDAYQQLDKPDFPSLVRELESNGQEGVAVSVLKKLVDLNIFATSATALPFEDWIKRSIIIDLKALDNDTRVLVVAFILNFFIERLNKNLAVKNGNQPLQMVLFVDEAHNILPKDGKAKLLEKLAREGRSWGFPLWLASQDADKFVSSGVDFAELASAGIYFSPQTLSAKEQKQILGTLITKPLEKGKAVLRIGGKTISGETRQFWRDQGQ
ncbi:MAG: hypothetical protein NTW21_41280 [Verrucomicrobia bacterium]|nr:hypothetical protein [Verrucomicrobiota bacterium]